MEWWACIRDFFYPRSNSNHETSFSFIYLSIFIIPHTFTTAIIFFPSFCFHLYTYFFMFRPSPPVFQFPAYVKQFKQLDDTILSFLSNFDVIFSIPGDFPHFIFFCFQCPQQCVYFESFALLLTFHVCVWHNKPYVVCVSVYCPSIYLSFNLSI